MIRSSYAKACLVLAPVLLCALWFAAPALAETYHVELVNGERYDSRYAPEEASWDSGLLLFHSETGNWVGIRRDEVARITIETEVRGAGRRIDSTTIYMGRTANAAPAPGAEGEVDPAAQLLQAIYEQNQSQQNYSIDQFVEPSATGGGIPVGFTQQVTPPIGVPSQNPDPNQ